MATPDFSISSSSSNDVADPVSLFLSFHFATDAVYQEGLAGIVQSGALYDKTEEEKADILRRSEIFYFNRVTGHSITVDDVLQRLPSAPEDASVTQQSNAATSVPSGSDIDQTTGGENETRTLSFAELTELIKQGKTDQIPNNRDIPNELNQAAPSESKAATRQKPWELNQPGNAT